LRAGVDVRKKRGFTKRDGLQPVIGRAAVSSRPVEDAIEKVRVRRGRGRELRREFRRLRRNEAYTSGRIPRALDGDIEAVEAFIHIVRVHEVRVQEHQLVCSSRGDLLLLDVEDQGRRGERWGQEHRSGDGSQSGRHATCS
jgi:hypothetical protein